MKYFMFSLSMFFIVTVNSFASDKIDLKKIGKSDLAKLNTLVSKDIEADKSEGPLFLDEDQSFSLFINGKLNYKLVPVMYNSIKAHNDICMLKVISSNNKIIKTIPIHYNIGDEDEVIASCVGVQAVSMEHIDNHNMIMFLIRNRVGNNYGDSAFIASVDAHKISKLDSVSACASENKNIGTIRKLKQIFRKCWNSYR